MDAHNLKIERSRDFGEILSDAAVLFFRNWKAFAWSMAYLTLPFFLLAFIVYFFVIKDYSEETMETAISNHWVWFTAVFVLFFLASIATHLISLSLVETYRKKGAVIHDLSELWITIKPVFWKMMGIGVATWLIPVLGGILGFIVFINAQVAGTFLLLFVVIGSTWYITNVMYASYIGMSQPLGIIESVKKSIELVNQQWWRAFGFFILLSIIINAVHSVLFLPFTVAQLIQSFSAISSGVESDLPKAGFTLLTMFQIVLYIIFNGYSTLCFNLKYYELHENRYGTDLERKINMIGTALNENR